MSSSSRSWLRGSFAGRIGLLLAVFGVLGFAGGYCIARAPDLAPVAAPAVMAALLLLALLTAYRALAPLRRLQRALDGVVASYRDGDFNLSLPPLKDSELGALVERHNELGRVLREQRQHLIQRELLLDTVVQNTPVALLLEDAHGHIVYANLAARHLLNGGRSPQGLALQSLLESLPESLRRALRNGEDSLLSVELDREEEVFHVSRRGFNLQGRMHRLYLLRRMTRELSRQEVATWKKVIRVLSHELNNTLAPISSLAHSGAELARRGDTQRLPEVFAVIGERVRHLHGFLSAYADFAKLPAPRPQAIDWAALLGDLHAQFPFTLCGPLPSAPGWFDRVQLEQVLINVLKNAHEAGGEAQAVELQIDLVAGEQRIEVRDRGSGMSEAVLAQALLPFYSTKRSGTGLGLALAREIVEAHGGRLRIANRSGGGLSVQLILPAA